MRWLLLLSVTLFLTGCGRSPPEPPPQTCQQQLIADLEVGMDYGVAARRFMDCAGLTVWDLIRLFS